MSERLRTMDKSFKVKAQPLFSKCFENIYPLLGVYPKEITFLGGTYYSLPKDWKLKKIKIVL